MYTNILACVCSNLCIDDTSKGIFHAIHIGSVTNLFNETSVLAS